MARWVAIVGAAGAAAGPNALADDLRWVGGSGAWQDASNWQRVDPPPGAGVPGTGDGAFVRTTDALDRVISIAAAADQAADARDLSADAVGAGGLTLRLDGGVFRNSGNVYLGTEGSANFVQTGGAAEINTLLLSRFGSGAAAATSTYKLSGGTLTTSWATQLGQGDSFASFHQTGGTHVTEDLFIDNGEYVLSGGLLRAAVVRATRGFRQTGGTADAGEVTDAYQWDGGSLSVRKRLAPSRMAFPLVPATLLLDCVVDFAYAELTRAQNTTLALGPHALMIRPADLDPGALFATYANAGIDHVAGTTLVIPAGRTIYGSGALSDPIECRGTLLDPDAGADPFFNHPFDVRGPFNVYEGGRLSAVSLSPRGAAGMGGGTLAANDMALGFAGVVVDPPPSSGARPVFGSFLQTGGAASVGALNIGPGLGNGFFGPSHGSYKLVDGSLSTVVVRVGLSGFFLGQGGSGEFIQTGGTLTVGYELSVGSGEGGPGVYELSGGTLRAESLVVSEAFQALFNKPLTYGDGTLRISDAGAVVRVGSELRFGPKAKLEAVPGAAIHLDAGAGMTVTSESPAALAGLAALRVIFDGTAAAAGGAGGASLSPDAVSTFEVAGVDVGPAEAGFADNFALGVLEIGRDGPASLKLVDQYLNRPPADGWPRPAEALYVDQLILSEGSTFDLNGLNVYVHQFIDEGGSLILDGGGALTVVPEPTAASMLALAGAGLALGRRRRNPRQRCYGNNLWMTASSGQWHGRAPSHTLPLVRGPA